MNFLKKLFRSKEKVNDVETFWIWFNKHHKDFYGVVKYRQGVENNFLNIIMPKLQELNEQFYCLAGMYNDSTAELIITPEGDIKNFVFAEDFIAAAPEMEGWRFTALKPPTGLDSTRIQMNGYTFDKEKISFFSNEHNDYPDEIDVTLIYSELTPENREVVSNGSLIFLDSALGELNAVTMIDSITVENKVPEHKESIPITKLNEFLIWREKEFVEKYKGVRRNTENDEYVALEGADTNGMPIVAIINQELLNWDAKASHPWIMTIKINYNSVNNGMPDSDTVALMNLFEEELLLQISDEDGYLNLGRETYNSARIIYFACKEFRQVSRITAGHIQYYSQRLQVSYDIIKDKYWMVMNKFNQ